MSKQNDLMLNVLANPNFTVQDFQNVGLSADNTSMEDEETYLKSDLITSNPLFQNESGEFDQSKFHKVYLQVAQGMNALNEAPQNYQATYSKYNIFAPVSQRNNAPEFELVKASNPDRLTKSMLAVGLTGPREFTPQEIAQSQKIWDSDKQEWIDTPENLFSFNKLFNDFTGFFSDNFGTTKVMAQYDEDIDFNGKKRGEEGFNENQIEHHKGDYMLNDNGTYYYRTLKDGENIYGKQVLHYSDILTREGSALNSVDFLDSDDIQKHTFGSFVKNASLIGAMFLPYVGTAIAGATIFQQAAGLGATLGKIALGSDNSTMNWLEGLSESTNLLNTRSEWSSIDYGNTGRNTTWTIENLLGMVGDVVGQLKQQRLLFEYSPTLLKGKWGINEENRKLLQQKYLDELEEITNKTVLSKYDINSAKYLQASTKLKAENARKAADMVEEYMKQYNKAGEELSKAYMTLLTVNDIYGEAKEAGAEDFDAAVITAGYAAMEYALLSTDIGKWILPELRGERLQNKVMVNALTKDVRESFNKLGKAATSSDEAKRTYLQKLLDFGKSVAKGEFNVGLGKRAAFQEGEGLMKAGIGSVIAGAMAEGVEEVSEEVLADFSRVLFNGLEKLQGKDIQLKPFENVIDRYGMSLLGGAIGGGVSSAAFDFRNAQRTMKMNYNEALQQLIHKAHNNDLDGIIKIIQEEELGNKNLSATKRDVDDSGNVIWKQGDEKDNQDIAIKKLVMNQLNLIKNTLDAHGGTTDDEFLSAQTLKDLRYRALTNTTTAGLFIQKYNETLTDLVQTVGELKDANSTIGKAENDEKDGTVDPNQEAKRKILEEKIKELDEKIEQFNSGAKAPLFMTTALIESTPYISQALMASTFKIYAEEKGGKPFEKLTQNELKKLEADYQNYLRTTKKDDLQIATKGYLVMSNLIKQNLEAAQKIIQKQAEDPIITQLLLDTSIGLEKLNFYKGEEEWQEEFGKWAAQSLLGDKLNTEVNLLYNSYQENLNNNKAIVDKANEQIAAKQQEIDKFNQELAQLREDSVNLGELADPTHEETLLNTIQKTTDELSAMQADLTKLENERKLADKESKADLDSKLQDIIFRGRVQQALNLANSILSQGFVNAAIKDQVVDRIDTTRTALEKAWNKADEMFWQEHPIDDTSFIDLIKQGNIEDAKELFEATFGNSKIVDDYVNLKNQYEPTIQELKQKSKEIKKLGYTPVMQNLDAFALGIGKQRVSGLIDTLGKILSTSRGNVQSFNVGNDLYKQINEAERVLDLYLAALEGARTDNVDPFRVESSITGEAIDKSNVWGINKVINEVHAKAPKIEGEDWVDLPEIEGMAADMMIEDVRRLKRMLNSYKTLYSINQGQKLNVQSRVAAKTTYLLYSKIKHLLTNADFPEKEKLEAELEKLSFLKEQTESKEMKIALTSDEEKKLKQERIQMEDAIYEYFQDKVDDIEALKKIFNPANFKMSDQSATLLTEGSEQIDDTSFIGYLAAKAAIKSSDFLAKYREILRDGSIAPLIGQEVATTLGLANVLNGKVISNIITAYRTSILELNNNEKQTFLKEAGLGQIEIDSYCTETGSKWFANHDLIPQYTNLTFIDGVPGSGKTKGVDTLIYKYLKTYHPEVADKVLVVHGGDIVGDEFSKNLASSLGIEEEKASNKEDLMNKFFENYHKPKPVNGKYQHETDDYIFDANMVLTPTWKIKNDWNSNNVPKVIFIDEAQQFTQLELLALDKLAREFGISVIMSGDLNQTQLQADLDIKPIVKKINKELEESGSSTQLSVETASVSLARNQVLHTPKQGTSMRTANNQKNQNMSNTQAIMALREGNLELHYFEDDTTIAGDKQLNKLDRDAIAKHLDKMISLLKEGEKIYYAHPVDDSSTYEYFKKQEKYAKYLEGKPGTALGQEGRFWIVELIEPNSFAFMQDFYTGQTRSTQFSLMLVPDKANNGKITITNIQDSETHKEEYSPVAIKKYADQEIKILDEILPKDTKDVPYNAREGVTSAPVTTTSEPSKPKTEEEKKKKREEFLAKAGTRTTPPTPTSLELEAKELVDNHTVTYHVRGRVTGNPYSGELLMMEGGRRFVMIDVYGVKVPFYVSTGAGMKLTVPIGKWYPFLGLKKRSETDYWLCKTTEADINNFYGIPLLKAIAEQLNAKYGNVMDKSEDPTNGKPIADIKIEDAMHIINESMVPFDSGTSGAQANIKMIEDAIRNHRPTELDLFNDIEEVPVADISPETDDLGKEALEDKLDENNGVNPDEGNTSSSFGLNGFRYNLFSNATFELGTSSIYEENGVQKFNPSPMQDGDKRIDGVNGIFSPEITDSSWTILRTSRNLEDAIEKLGELRRLLMSTMPKAMITQKVIENLGLADGAFIRYAIKTSAGDTDYDASSSDFGKLEKEVNQEPLPFARAQRNPNSDSKFDNNRNLVAIIGVNGKDVIEIPLLTLNNPITIIRQLDKTDPVRIVFDQAYNQSQNTVAGLQAVLNTYKGDPNFQGLVDLITEYLMTYRHIMFIPDQNWTPAQSLYHLGVQLNINRGLKIYDNDEYIQTQNYVSLDKLTEDKSFARISKPLQLASGEGKIASPDGSMEIKIANPKHPFVLYTDSEWSWHKDTNEWIEITNDQVLIDEFIYQQFHDVPKTIQLAYIVPPQFDLKTYLRSLVDFMVNSTGSPLGNQRTPFKILEALFTNEKDGDLLKCFINALGETDGTALYNKTKEIITELSGYVDRDGNPDVAKQAKILTERNESWPLGNVGIPKEIPLYRQLQNVLKQLVHPQSVILNEEGIYTSRVGIDRTAELLPPLQTIFDRAKVTLFYQVKGDRTKSFGQFILIQTDSNGHIQDRLLGNQPFGINGSIASSAFETTDAWNNMFNGMMGRLSIRPGWVQNSDTFSYVGGYSGWRTNPTPRPQIKSIHPNIVNYLTTTLKNPVLVKAITDRLTPTKENDNSTQIKSQIVSIINNNIASPFRALFDANGNIIIGESDEFTNKQVIFKDFDYSNSGISLTVVIGNTEFDGQLIGKDLYLTERRNSIAGNSLETAKQNILQKIDQLKERVDFSPLREFGVSQEELDEYEELLKDANSSPEEVLDIIQMLDPDIKISEDSTTCGLEFKISFK